MTEFIEVDAATALWPLLRTKNGFLCFEGALRVFSATGNAKTPSLAEWNDPRLWRHAFEGMAGTATFFAEDVFGGQFCLRDGRVATFDPETGAFEDIAGDLEEWAAMVLADVEVLTGYPIAHEWQLRHGRLPENARLIPVTPFVMGGEYTIENLRSIEAAEGMRYRASIALQLRDLPDGAAVKLVVD